MLVLAVDTTSAHGSMAVLDGRALKGIIGFRTARPRHAEGLLPTLEELLVRTDRALADLDGFAVCVGPGSFTGLRIGIAAVEGLAFSLDRPAVGISALEATAHHYRHRRGVVGAMLEAYRDEVYGACYRSDGESVTPITEPACMAARELIEAWPTAPELLGGSAIERYREVLEECLPPSTTLAESSPFIAEDVARLGRLALEAGERAPLGGLDALYIRAPEAERKRLETQVDE